MNRQAIIVLVAVLFFLILSADAEEQKGGVGMNITIKEIKADDFPQVSVTVRVVDKRATP